MSYERARRMFQEFAGQGGPFDWTDEQKRLLVYTARAVATGVPVTTAGVAELAARAGLSVADAEAFLEQVAERDDDGNVVGVFGLSQRRHKHEIVFDGVALTTWCAEDTLFLPAVVGLPARVRSVSPGSEAVIELEVTPTGVARVEPAQAVLTVPIVDAADAEVSSASDIWMTFCRQIHFFPSRPEAEAWAAGRGDIAVVSVAEGFELGRMQFEDALRLVDLDAPESKTA